MDTKEIHANGITLVNAFWGAGIAEEFGVVVGTQPGTDKQMIRWLRRGIVSGHHVKPSGAKHTGIGVWEIRPDDIGYDRAFQLLLQGYDGAEENCDGHPVYHGKLLTEVLAELKRRGLAYSDVVALYGVPRDENPYAAFIQKHLANDNDMELDDQVIISESETGCWVSCWCYVEDEAVGVDRRALDALTLVVDLDERGIFKAHVENHTGNSIFEFSNEDEDEDENGNPSEDGLWLVTAGYMRHGRDANGLLEYLRETGLVTTSKNTISVIG